MKRVVLAATAALLATMAIGAQSAFAAPAPETVICSGAAQSNGSFVPQEVNTGPIPGVPLSLGVDLCAVVNGAGLVDSVSGLVEGIGEAEPPSEPPSQEQIEAILEDIQGLDPTNPIEVLVFVSNTCANLNSTDVCNAIVGGVLSAVLPLTSMSAELVSESSAFSCNAQEQSGTGSVTGGGARFDLTWTADYEAGGNAVGVISGTAENTSFDEHRGEISPLSGFIGPGCGAGSKVLILQIG